MIDQGSWYLCKICDLATPGNEFSITYNAADQYYYIAIGESKYAAPVLTLEWLMEAYIYIMADIRKRQVW